eukprot:jgi/Chlat1/7909/Chrsp68S07351
MPLAPAAAVLPAAAGLASLSSLSSSSSSRLPSQLSPPPSLSLPHVKPAAQHLRHRLPLLNSSSLSRQARPSTRPGQCSAEPGASSPPPPSASQPSTPPQQQDTAAAAWRVLDEYNLNDAAGKLQSVDRIELRDCVLAAAEASAAAGESPLLGICTSDARLAVKALRQYTAALNCLMVMPESRVSEAQSVAQVVGPVYVKYNAGSQVCYASRYEGASKGVILQLGQRQVGHLPLGLFDGYPA